MDIEDSTSYRAYEMSQEPIYRNIVDSKINCRRYYFYILLGYSAGDTTIDLGSGCFNEDIASYAIKLLHYINAGSCSHKDTKDYSGFV
jgi:hypothetical protein